MFNITQHFADRARQRGVTEREIIDCLTHGTKHRQNNKRTRFIAKSQSVSVAYEIAGRTVNLITCYRTGAHS